MPPSKHIKSLIRISLVFLIFSMLGFSLVIPIFTKQEPLLADEVTEEPYHYWFAPEESFGVSEIKTVNDTYMKALFNKHIQFLFEVKVGQNWYDVTDACFSIEKTWNETNNFWKLNFIFDTFISAEHRMTFAIDLPVLSYVDKQNNYQYWLNYTIPNTNETYHMFWDWSDIKDIGGISFSKGFNQNCYWFRLNKYLNVGYYNLDPIFGDTSTYTSFIDYAYNMAGTKEESKKGLKISATTTVDIDNITAYVKEDSSGTVSSKCAIYTASGSPESIVANGISDEVEVSGSSAHWVVFPFSGTKPSLTEGNDYYIVIWGDGDDCINNWEHAEISRYSVGSHTYITDSSALTTYPTFDTSWTSAEYTLDTSAEVSIYASYTVVSEEWNLYTTCSDITGGNVSVQNLIQTCSDITGGNVSVQNLIQTCSDITGGNVSVQNLIQTCSDITGGNVSVQNLIQTCSDITGGNVSVQNLIQTCSDITGGNVSVQNLIQTCSDITGGNVSVQNLIQTCSDITGGNITGFNWILYTTCLDITGGNVSTQNLIQTCSDITGGNVSVQNLIQTCSDITGGNVSSQILHSTCSDITGGNVTGLNWLLYLTCSDITGGNISIWNLELTCSDITGGNISDVWNLYTTCSDITGGNITVVNHTIDELWEYIDYLNDSLIKEDDTVEIIFVESVIILILAISLLAIGVIQNKKSGGIFIATSGSLFISLLLSGEFSASFNGTILLLGAIVIILGFYKLFFQKLDKEGD